jgi:hypothetical protein
MEDRRTRKVQFNECVIFHILPHNEVWKNYRTPSGELCARDRMRFFDKILLLETLIGPVLSSEHRSLVLLKRF